LCIHKKMLDYYNVKEVKRKEVISHLMKTYRIPKRYAYLVLREFKQMGLVKEDASKEITIVDCKTDLDTPSEIYKRVGVF